jgi:hypothetical protein
MRRREVKRRLTRTLAGLNSYYHGTSRQLISWPSRDFLELVEADVGSLSGTSRISWKTFRRVDGRMPSLRLVLRLDNLANRALTQLNEQPHCMRENAKPLIQWLVRMEHPIVVQLGGVNGEAALVITKQKQLDADARREKQRLAARLRKQRERMQKKFDKKP